jgi:RNA polymerase sigma factor (TIGR02999 family)
VPDPDAAIACDGLNPDETGLLDIELTALLRQWRSGDQQAEARLIEVIYPVLRALAHRQLSGDKRLTVQPTELAHEAYFRLAGQRHVDWQNRAHFFAIVGRVVRRVVIDYIRERETEKRGRNEQTVSIDHLVESDMPSVENNLDWLRMDQLLNDLEVFDADSARIVEMRYFVGLSVEETAQAMGVSTATLGRQWRTARAWLHERLQGQI